MSSHRSERPRPRRRVSARTRALLSLGVVVALASGLSVRGTLAFWTDTANVQSATFASGTMDITVDGQLAGTGTTNNPGSYTETGFALPNMVPGESYAISFPVKNNGSIGLTYTVTGTGSGGLAVANGMQYSVTFGASAANSGSAVNGNRSGTCGGTASTDANTTALTSSATSLASSRALASGASETVCIIARFSSAAGNGLQGLSGSAAFQFAAKQVGAP